MNPPPPAGPGLRRGETGPAVSPWWIWIGISAVYVLFRWNLLDIPFDRDEGFFGYGGQVLLRGGALYRDFIDHKPPLVFGLYALILRWVPSNPVSLHLVLHLWNALTAVVFYRLALRWFDRPTARWAVVLYSVLSSAAAVQGFTASTELFLLLPLAISLWALPPVEATGWRARLMLSGALGATAFWIKSQALPAVLLVGVAAGLSPRGGPAGGRMARWVFWGAGALAATVWVALPFAATGRWGDLWFWTFEYNRLYAAGADFWRVGVWGTGKNLGALALEHPGALALALGGLASDRSSFRSAGAWPLGLLGAGALGALPGFAFPHYLALLLPGLAMTGAQGIAALERRRAWSALSPKGRALALGVGLVGAPLLLGFRYYVAASGSETSVKLFGANPFVESALIADFLRRRSDSADRVFILGSEPEILLASERLSATPFVNMRTLFDERWTGHAEQQRACLAILRDSPPPWIVGFPPRLFLPERAADAPDFLQRVGGLLAENYRAAAVVLVGPSGGRLVEWGAGSMPALPVGGKIWIFRRLSPPDSVSDPRG